jgi:hypothetical protein
MSAPALLASLCLLAVEPGKPSAPPAREKPLAAPAGESAVPKVVEKPADEPLDVRYCRAQLELAEANLARLDSLNRKIPRSVPESIVVEYKHDVAAARVRLERAQAGAGQDEFAAWLRRAKGDYDEAASRWKIAVAVTRQSRTAFDPQDVERFRLRAEVYRLQYERGLALAEAPREAQLEWRVELLANELERVKEDATRITPAARYYYYSFPFWW